LVAGRTEREEHRMKKLGRKSKRDLFGHAMALLQVLLVSDFGPRTAMKIVDGLRKDILKGTLKSGPDIKVCCNFSSFLFVLSTLGEVGEPEG
jgi:signal recognition particle GTPase